MTTSRAMYLAKLVSEGDFSASAELVVCLRRLGLVEDGERSRVVLGSIQRLAPWSYTHDRSGIVHLAWSDPEPPVMFGLDDRLGVHYSLLCGSWIIPGFLKRRERVLSVPDGLCVRCRRVLLSREE